MIGDSKQLLEAVNVAKEAVQGLEEPLKTEAFRILLDKLVSGGGGTKLGRPSSARRLKPRASPGAPKRTAAPPTTSSLKLGVDDLRKLKTYCERFDLDGTEQVAFILANFCREHTELQYITAADVVYLYRQLVSQKAKVLAVNDPADWARALNWLTAPSRRKEWLERSGGGYIVSNGGLLRFHELESAPKTKATN